MNNTMTYTYKPTIQAIQYTGSIDEVIEFIGRENISHLDTDIYDDPSIGDLVINLYAITTIILAYEKYLVKETFDDGKIEYKTMSEDEFKRYFKQINTPKSLDQAVCDTTESAADTTPCEDKPEQGGEENQQLHDKIDLLMKYENWRKRHDPVVLDWANGEQEKWSLYYASGEDVMGYDWVYAYSTVGTLYFSTRKHAERFYNEHKDLIHAVIENGDVLGVE